VGGPLERKQDPEGCNSKNGHFCTPYASSAEKSGRSIDEAAESMLRPLFLALDSPRRVRRHNREPRGVMRERADHIGTMRTARGSPQDRSVHGLGQRGRLADNDEALRTKRGNIGRL